jgi:hypothetical protein
MDEPQDLQTAIDAVTKLQREQGYSQSGFDWIFGFRFCV